MEKENLHIHIFGNMNKDIYSKLLFKSKLAQMDRACSTPPIKNRFELCITLKNILLKMERSHRGLVEWSTKPPKGNLPWVQIPPSPPKRPTY